MRIVYFIILFKFVCNYAKNQGLSNSLADMNNVLGAKNLLPNNAESLTYGGITFTVNSDGSVTANGTATELVLLFYVQKFKPNNGNYILSGGIRNGAFVFVNENNGTTFVRNVVSIGNDTQFTLNYSDYDNLDCGVGIESGVTVNNETFYPMLRLATIEDDTYVPYSMTNREMTPYVQSISNPNLLDNPWFTVNQRDVEKGVSITTTTVRYWWDRWYCNSNRTFTYNTDNSITSSNIDIWQIIEGGIEKLQGRTITLSIMLADGTIKSGTYNVPQGVPSTNQFISVFNNDGINIVFGRLPSGNAQFSLLLGQNKTIKATKLELGSVSTLAMDTAPNYQQELAKCQRYFQRIKSNQNGMQAFYTIATSSSSLRGLLILQENMRNKPTITISDITGITLYNSGTPKQVNSLAIENIDANNRYVKLTMGSSNVAINEVYAAEIANGVYIDFSADL